MIKSMTGFGRARKTLHLRDITVEVRAVNNRYLDCTVKMPRIYTFAEDALRSLVQRSVSRGKVDVMISVDATAADVAEVRVNEPLAKSYYNALLTLGSICGDEHARILPTTLASFPEVLSVTKAEEDLDTVKEDLCEVLSEALEAFQTMRAAEGEKLAADFTARLTTIEGYTAEIERRSPETVAAYRQALTEKMQEILQTASIDEQRILTEAAIYANKVAVDEETVRLRSHIAQFRTMVMSNEPIGRKMDFLTQEINRESNTIGSKCADLAISEIVVDLKAEIEKIREQVQNVE